MAWVTCCGWGEILLQFRSLDLELLMSRDMELAWERLYPLERKLAASGMLPSMLFSPLALGKAKWLLEKVVGNSFGACFS